MARHTPRSSRPRMQTWSLCCGPGYTKEVSVGWIRGHHNTTHGVKRISGLDVMQLCRSKAPADQLRCPYLNCLLCRGLVVRASYPLVPGWPMICPSQPVRQYHCLLFCLSGWRHFEGIRTRCVLMLWISYRAERRPVAALGRERLRVYPAA